MLKGRNIVVIALLAAVPAWAGQGSAQFDLSQMPGSYVARTSATSVQVKIDHPEILKQALDDGPPDSSPNNPSMDTDDGATVGPHAIEVDIVSDCERASDDRGCDLGVTYNYGISEHAQVTIQKFVTHDKIAGQAATTNYSGTAVGAKVNFLDRNGIEAAVAPAITLGDSSDDEGHVVFLPIMISKQVGPRTTVGATVGVSQSLEHANINSLNMSVAIGRAVTATSKVMAEISSARSPDEKITYARIGYLKVVFAKPASRYQVSAFSAVARTVGQTPEGKPRYAVRFGLVVNRSPRSQD